MTIFNELKELGEKLSAQTSARLFLVGGAVRDLIMKKDPKDFDLEVFHITPRDFQTFLTNNNIKFDIEPNAKFPVIRFKLANEDIEVGFPRLENKTGSKHSDFEINVKPDLTFKEACRRRDFTFNAMLMDVITGAIIDPFDGIIDIKNHQIKVCNENTFREDALRILRAMQFISRFELNFENVLKSINQEMIDELNSLDPSSIWLEFQKMINKGTEKGIQLALDFLLRLSKDFGLFPIFNKLSNTPQSKKHHGEGNVFNHTKMVVKEIGHGDRQSLFFLSALTHDMGKPETTKITEDKITAYGHDKKTIQARDFLNAIGTPKKLLNKILFLIEQHMLNSSMKNKTCFKLADKFEKAELTLRDLIQLKIADNRGRISENEETKLDDVKKMIVKFGKLEILDKPLDKLISGHDILNIKKIEGKKVGQLLKDVRDLQFNEKISTHEEAIKFIERRLSK